MARQDPRAALSGARRVIVKVGSHALSRDPELPRAIAEQIADLRKQKRSFVVVTSGAIALGCHRLGFRSRPKEMAKLQAAASAGQVVLMRSWDDAFGAAGLTGAQVLLTHSDLADRERLNNAREALAALLEAGAVPIVNENDTVATDEIRFGDNDQLAAMVAPLVGADLVILLTDVEGVLDDRGKRISVMTPEHVIGTVKKRAASVGSGGMQSKLDAAGKGRRAGATVVVASAFHPEVVRAVLGAEDVGTLFPRTAEPLRARKHWIAFTLRPRGTVILDEGAVRAIAGGKSSLLPVGVLGIRGQFNPGDSVRLVGADGVELGRGLARLGAVDVARAAGKRGPELELLFGAAARDLVIVHKDDLVLAT